MTRLSWDKENTTGSSGVTVPISACASYLGFSYGASGFHPLRAAAEDILSDPRRDYSSSRLSSFFEHFTPATVADAHMLSAHDAPYCASLAASEAIHIYPWSRRHKYLASGQCQHYGPAPDAGPHHFRVMHKLSLSISQHGYRRWYLWGNGVRGIWLICGRQSRFILRGGQHRVAVLAAMGHTEVRAKAVETVRLDDIDRWPLVGDGIMGTDEARAIADRYFALDGSERAP